MSDDDVDESKQIAQTEINRDNMGRFQMGNKEGNRWGKGTSGNPAGRPSPKPMEEELNKALKRGKGKALRTIIAKLVSTAEKGDMVATRMVLDRIDGPVVQRSEVEVSGKLSWEERLAELEAMKAKQKALPAPKPALGSVENKGDS